MKMNFKGLVNLHTLPLSLPLLPLYEAVVNSIQSIEDSKINDGQIDIIIERDNQETILNTWEKDIENIVIRDNGIGFTDSNYNSFNTYASEYKLQKGCRGVGRMIWLKAFSSVEVNSVYEENNKKKRRCFLFDSDQEVHDMIISESDNSEKKLTEIRLNLLNSKYRPNCAKKIETIARNILNHCFAYYVLGKAPKIIVTDNIDTVNLDEIYKENMSGGTSISNININNIEFKLIHSKNYMFSGDRHQINLCANNRVVQQIGLSKLFSNLNTRLQDEKGEFTYTAYVLSSVLDNHVNRERTKFELPDQPNMVEDIGMNEILSEIKKEISIFLENDIKESNKKKEEIIKEYVFTRNPKYRLLLKNYPQLINDMPWVSDEEKIEMELFKQEQKYKLELKKEGKKLEEEAKIDIVDYESYIQKRTEYAEKLSDIGKSNLAEYVMHRKSVLDILASNLKYRDSEKKRYAYEKNIHQLIFPMTKTSDDIDYMQHNLWIIDEKLAYHHYLASDTKLKSMSEIECKSGNEPDIVIFDSPFAFTDEDTQPYRNITIIEFKRPGRENYTDDENPIRQVKEYMDNIIEGKIKSKDGEFLSDTESIRFFCYIICDIDNKMHRYAKLDDLKKTPDSVGYYKYIDSYKAYMEIIPYNKLIQDSQRRNKILFDKLFDQI